jgi:hypothetical protein
VFWSAGALTLAIELATMRHLGVELQAGVLIPTLRDGFWLAPDTMVHEVAAVGGTAALTLSAFAEGV